VQAARFARLTTRNDNRLTRQQACAARAAALLRWLHVLITRRVHLEPGHPRQPPASAHGRLTQATTASPGGASPNGASRKTTSRMSMGSPRPSACGLDCALPRTTRLSAGRRVRICWRPGRAGRRQRGG